MTSQNLTDAQNVVANVIGQGAMVSMTNLVAIGVSYGVSLVIFLASLDILRKRLQKARLAAGPALWLSGLILIMLALSTAYFALNICEGFAHFQFANDVLVPGSTPPLKDRLQAANVALSSFTPAMDSVQLLNVIAGDVVVVWRALALWPRSWLLKIGMWACILANIALSIWATVEHRKDDLIAAGDASKLNSVDWISAAVYMSFAINVVATAMILLKFWFLRRLGNQRGERKPIARSRVHNILVVLVECGFVYCALQLFIAVTSSQQLAVPGAVALLNDNIIVPLSGAYTSVIVILVANQKSSIDGTDIIGTPPPVQDQNHHPGNSHLSTIHFANRAGGDAIMENSTSTKDENDPSAIV